MKTISAMTTHYDGRTILLHWLTVALVTTLWALGQTIDWFPKGLPRTSARSTHIVLGVALAIVLAARVRWRFGGGGVELPPAGVGWLDTVATFVHGLLYLLLAVTVVLGLANAWIRGDSIFNMFSIPSLAPGNQSLRDAVEDWHGLAANSLLAVAGFHAAAALAHRFFWHDDVLQRMLWRGRR